MILQQAVTAGDDMRRGISIAHDGVGLLPVLMLVMVLIHHRLRGTILKSVEVKLHAVAHISHAAHVKELVEFIFGCGSHMLVLTIPGS